MMQNICHGKNATPWSSFGRLFSSLSPNLHENVAYANYTTHETWVNLEECFSQDNAARVDELKHDLTITHQGNMTVVAYYTKMKGLWDKVTMY